MNFSNNVSRKLFSNDEWESLILRKFCKTYLAEVNAQCQKVGKDKVLKTIFEDVGRSDYHK